MNQIWYIQEQNTTVLILLWRCLELFSWQSKNRQNGKIVSKMYFVNINLSVELYHIRDITFKIVLIFGKKALSYITCLYLTYTHKQYWILEWPCAAGLHSCANSVFVRDIVFMQ